MSQAMNKELARQAKNAIVKEIAARKIPAENLSFILPQMLVETAGFTSNVSRVNNLSGIIFVGQKLAYDSGIPLPAKERTKYGNYNYAGFKSVDNWAKEYLNILQRKNIIPAKNLTEFAQKLKSERYFTATLPDYEKALFSWLPQLKNLFRDVDFTAVQSLPLPLLMAAILLLIFSFSK